MVPTWRQQADTTAVLWNYGYDQADQLISAVKHATDTPQTVLQRFSYAYDPAGNRTVEQIDDVVTLSAYDHLNRLTSQAPGGPMVIAGTLSEPGTVTISGTPAVVDANHNFRGTVPTATGTNTFTIVAKDATGNTTTQQYEVDQAGAAKTFAYDANGNLTSDGTRAFEWDARNQLLAASAGTLRNEWVHDGLQQRALIIRKDNGVVQSETKLVWCAAHICEERAADGTTLLRRTFVDGHQTPSQDRFLTSDHLGSVVAAVDDASTSLSRYEYDPWGRRSLTAGSDLTPFGFTGHQWDDIAQVWMAQYRSYDPGMGRWTSQDPAGMVDGPNTYAYVRNAPTVLTDLKGLWAGGVGINLSATAAVVWGGTMEGGAIAVSDSQGNVGLLLCGGGGIGNGLSISTGWQGAAVACPQCKSICDLEGPCFGLGGHIAKGPGIGVGGGTCVGSAGFTVTMSAGPVAGIGVFGGAMVGSCKLLWKRKECCP